MNKARLKFKKLLNEYRSLTYELEYVEFVSRTGNEEFEVYYRKYCSERDIDLAELNKNNSTKVDNIFNKSSTAIKKAVEEKMRKEEYDPKKIFRQIAKKFHPDLIGNDPRRTEYEEAFKNASNAIDTGCYGKLFDIAEKYDFDLDEYDKINAALKKDIDRIKKEVEAKKSTYGFLLQECEENKDCMDNVVKRFLKHLFNI